mgnify:CR=1 FL=1
MGRRKARETALGILFQLDSEASGSPRQVLRRALEDSKLPEEERSFVEDVVLGTRERLTELDAVIREYAVGWSVERMPRVDRNVLRLALYEILYRDDVPTSVSINEAVELAKKYSTEDSGRFVNGILGNLVRSRRT